MLVSAGAPEERVATCRAMRICLVYDCLYPYTIGGGERWYRNLAEALARAGHEVTYLTMRAWEAGDEPQLEGVRVVAVAPGMDLYTGGRRRIAPPLVFGAGVLAHLLRHGRRYEVVHTASFPYFSLLGAAIARRLGRYRIVVDWHELWTREYWLGYLGGVGGRVGWWVQRLCLRVRQRAFCFSRLHARRLRELGLSGEPTVLEGEFTGPREPAEVRPSEPLVVFAGRHIPEKRVPALVQALPRVRERLPELRCEIYGDGPDRPEVLRLIEELRLDGAAQAPGKVSGERVADAMLRALCMVLPSQREGYGLVVVEASASATPSVVVDDPDNAAVELVDDGRNGVIARSVGPADLADAILRVHDAGEALRVSTAEWYRENAERLSLDSSLAKVVASYVNR
jgi:glycosyltransferase involved in cell wall biosynthesis